MLVLMDSGGSWENDRTEGSELRVVTPATLSKAGWSRSFCVSLHLGDKEAPFLWVQGAHLSREVLRTCVREEGGVGEGQGQRGLPAPAVSPTPSAEIFHIPRLGCPKPRQS